MLILARHGRTEANARGVLLGRADPGLDDEGVRQADRLGTGLAGLDVVRVVSSPLGRCRASAEVIADALRSAGGTAGGADVTVMAPSLVRAADVVEAPPARDWSGEIALLTVGRIDAEKNPLLLVEAMAVLLRDDPGRYRLRWVGSGPLAGAVQERAAELGIQERIELLGYVAFGPRLLDLYRDAHAFVHVSLTEGIPQVLVEALASGTPVVATDVGGVRGGLGGGRAGLLVPPDDLEALVEAVRRLAVDAELREGLALRGLELARARTLEAEGARIATFLAKSKGRS